MLYSLVKRPSECRWDLRRGRERTALLLAATGRAAPHRTPKRPSSHGAPRASPSLLSPLLLGILGQSSGRPRSWRLPLTAGFRLPRRTPQPGGWGWWSLPLLEAHQVFDQLPHVGVAVHLAELAVEEPVSVSLAPGRREETGVKRWERNGRLKPLPGERGGSPTKTGRNLCQGFGNVFVGRGW